MVHNKVMIWQPVKIAICYYRRHSGKVCTVVGLNSYDYKGYYYEYAKLPLCFVCENIIREYHGFYVPITKRLRSMYYWTCEEILMDNETFTKYRTLYLAIKEINSLQKNSNSLISLLPMEIFNIIIELVEYEVRVKQSKYKEDVEWHSITDYETGKAMEHKLPISYNCDWSK